MSGNIDILVEAFGVAKNTDYTRKTKDGDRLSLPQVLYLTLNNSVIDLESVDTIYTGMDEDVTNALEEMVEAAGLSAEVQPFFLRWKPFLDDDDVDDKNEAWAKAFKRRDEHLFIDADFRNDNYDGAVDAAVVVNTTGDRGEMILDRARDENVDTMELQMKELVDWDTFYDDIEDDDEDDEQEADDGDANGLSPDLADDEDSGSDDEADPDLAGAEPQDAGSSDDGGDDSGSADAPEDFNDLMA